jgi:RNA polymerase sigma-70 factor, ECF subfamily
VTGNGGKSSLAAVFWTSSERSDPSPRNLDSVLTDALVQAHTRWPTVNVADAPFVAHLGGMRRSEDPVAWLLSPHLPELYLAFACVQKDPEALAILERELLAPLQAQLARRQSTVAQLEEVFQGLREHLLLGEKPRLLQYEGKGPLAGWLKVVATRLDLQLKRSASARVEEDQMDAQLANGDPELLLLKQRYGQAVTKALKLALRELEPRLANVLRLHYLDRLSTEAIGTGLQIHARTVQRWLAEAREQVLSRTEKKLAEQLELAPSDLVSLVRLVRSQLHLSVADLLGSRKPS